MKNFFSLLFGCCILAATSLYAQQTLVSYELMESYTLADVQDLADDLGIPDGFVDFNYGVDLYKVIYMTPNVTRDSMVTASGVVGIPQGLTCSVPMASYHHGTTAHDEGVPSRGNTAELNIGIFLASLGSIASLPDYLGLGDSPGFHPYVHAKSEATCGVDMLRAARELAIDEMGSRWNEQLYLLGYSQGGHSCLATHREIQQFHSDEFTVTASIPMSGPYDVSGVQADVIRSNDPYPAPAYLPYIVFAYQEAYGNLYNDVSEVLISPWDTILPPMFDRVTSIGAINSILPSVPNSIMQPSQVADFDTNAMNPLRIALADNDLYDWTPENRVRMVYCDGDQQVTYLNALVARDSFLARGVDPALIETVNAFPGLDHNDCVLFAITEALEVYEEMTDLSNGMSLVTTSVATSPGASTGQAGVSVLGGSGSYSYLWSNGATTSSITGVMAGPYSVIVTDNAGCEVEAEVFVGGVTGIYDDLAVAKVEVYPNPAHSLVTVVLPDINLSGYTLSLVDITGKSVWSSEELAVGEHAISVDNFVPGVYVVELRGERVFRNKLVVGQ